MYFYRMIDIYICIYYIQSLLSIDQASGSIFGSELIKMYSTRRYSFCASVLRATAINFSRIKQMRAINFI